jgi:hypothetical protein
MRSVTERYESMAQRGRTPEQIRAVAIARDDRELAERAQVLARDVLVGSLGILESAGLRPVRCVHDEILLTESEVFA